MKQERVITTISIILLVLIALSVTVGSVSGKTTQVNNTTQVHNATQVSSSTQVNNTTQVNDTTMGTTSHGKNTKPS